MSEIHNPMDVLNTLMEERARYEQWLAQLDARKGTTPPHVFQRVHADYSERLIKVHEQLAGRASDLQVTAGTLADRVAALYADETALRDERAEAELRAAVGEFSLDHAREVMERCDEAIATLGAERESVGAELGRVQEILAVATRPVTPSSGEQPIVPIETLAPPTAKPSAPPAEAQAMPPVPAKAPEASSFDELAFLHSVVDKPAPAPQPATGPADMLASSFEPRADARASSAPASSRSPMFDQTDTDDTMAKQPVSARRAAPTPVLTSAPLVAKEGQEPGSTLTPGSIPAFLKDVPTEQIKTLKCQECGTMNYPTEWYCERCGGELAAM